MKTAEDIITEKNRETLSVTRDTLIYEAVRIMVTNKVGAILVRENEEILGVWTERDLLRNTLEEGFDPKTTTVAEVMITELHSAPHTDTTYNLMDKFLGLRVRHLPVEKNGNYIGLLSIGDVIRANLHEKTRELEALNAVVSWDYYEDWHFTSLDQAKEQMTKEIERPSGDIVG